MKTYTYGGDQPLTAAERLAMAHETSPTQPPTHRLEDFEFLIKCGCAVEDALKRSGFNSRGSFAKAATRHGRQDLIRMAGERIAS